MIETKVFKSRGKDMLCLIEYKDPSVRGKKVIVYKHGFCGHKITGSRKIVNFGHQMVDEGYTMIRFDCVGAGDSEGDWSYMTISGECEDFNQVLCWVKEELAPKKMMILGYSMGGLEAALCSRTVELNGILFWSPVGNAEKCFRHIVGDELYDFGLKGNDVDLAGDRIGKEFFLDIEQNQQDGFEAVKGYDKPVYFVHGNADTCVPYENSTEYMKVLPQAERTTVEGAGHDYESWKMQDELFEASRKYVHAIMDD
ncbi:MAG: alpha/beta hydrolase [Oscillospiraceae bacterium]|nr:alpha/beta hydrolase [Oscillospiraceae bacterium]